MGKLDGRVAIVTGAAMGIGRGVAGALAHEGANVIVADVDETAGAGAAKWLIDEWGVQAKVMRTDVTERDQVHAMVDAATAEFGRLDILVNNAWRPLGYARLEKTAEENMRAGFDMGVMAAFWAMQRAYPALAEHGTGRVINMCSLNGVNATCTRCTTTPPRKRYAA